MKSRAAAIVTRVVPILTSLIILLTGTSFGQISGQGALTIIEPDGKSGAGCPLEHTSVNSEISGFVARVSVTQTFHNPRKDKIEAVYTFPLSSGAAVDEMVMRVGDRVVQGSIKRREEAREIYEKARERGNVASLLDQERPNIFTQSVANIMPGEKVAITIKYVEVLPFENGLFKFVFPMVVGPRFIPGEPVTKQGTGWAPDTDLVPDASRITPPVTPEGTRAGHDIDIMVHIDAGIPISTIESKLHDIVVRRDGETRARVSLKNSKEIPNKDFVLTYVVAGDEVRSGVLTHKQGNEGYTTVIMIPPARVIPEQIAPRELIFVIDCSGSQRGWPLEKAKETMRYVLDQMNPKDTFNIIDFNQGVRMLFSEPGKNTRENKERALRYLHGLQAQGGTWMGPAIEAVCKTEPAENRLRIVTFMTDGYVGNDFEIISLVKRLRGKSRWFPFGTGNSVNRFLLDTMARVGGGQVEYVLLNTSGEAAAKKFYERIAAPVLTDISFSFDRVQLEDVYPAQVSDLWSQKPLVFKARYTAAGTGSLTIRGLSEGKPYEKTLNIVLPQEERGNQALAVLWARAKVEDLMDRDLLGMQRGNPDPRIKEEIIRVALAHGIMTQFTSFVAVEETIVTIGGKPTRVTVPVEMPDGVSREGVFGEQNMRAAVSPIMSWQAAPGMPAPQAVSKRVTMGMGMKDRARATAGSSRESSVIAPSEHETSSERNRPKSLTTHERAIADESPLSQKLAPALRALLQLKEGGPGYTGPKVEVKDGKINVQVWINDATEKTLKQLGEVGLQISFKAATGKTVVGTIAVDNLETLVKLSIVRFVEPLSV